ncbi:hypothetical protein JAAARDRAFT_157341 [Jaapia argillacea MUCL 33604]|uniref:Uncharacterized protein n=1 Tax=Jaapia argillacea MUCL 33604 TaxID=933084 RepID=A0A067Q3N3_9AGAM|nr:hypothetical protein JAAARDRAFT_157341 [Jaapia argillacea MUCL 33604]
MSDEVQLAHPRHHSQPLESSYFGSSYLPTSDPSTYGTVSAQRGSHPRLTGYRFFVIVSTAGFGLSKAYLSYKGQSTAPNTLDWLYGVVVFLLIYWLGIYETHSALRVPWLFGRK